MSPLLRGMWLELRIIPVLLWSFSAITLGTALGAGGDVNGWYYLGAVALGLLIQGVLAHTVNELEDWRSGTDRHASPRIISGGNAVPMGTIGGISLAVLLGLGLTAMPLVNRRRRARRTAAPFGSA